MKAVDGWCVRASVVTGEVITCMGGGLRPSITKGHSGVKTAIKESLQSSVYFLGFNSEGTHSPAVIKGS